MTNKRRQEKAIFAGVCRGKEEKAPGRKQKQAGEESRFIAAAFHEETRRQREQKIAQVERRLHQSSLEPANLERLHELPDEHVVQVIGNAPEKEQPGNEHKRTHHAGRQPCRRGGGLLIDFGRDRQ